MARAGAPLTSPLLPLVGNGCCGGTKGAGAGIVGIVGICMGGGTTGPWPAHVTTEHSKRTSPPISPVLVSR